MAFKTLIKNPTFLIIFITAIILHAALAIFAFTYLNKSKELMYVQTYTQLKSITDHKHNELKQYFNEKMNDLQTLTQMNDVHNYLDKSIKSDNKIESLDSFIFNHKYEDLLLMGNINGQNIIQYSVKNPKLVGEYICEKNNNFQKLDVLFDNNKLNQSYVMDMQVCKLYKAQTPVFTISKPVVKDNKVVAVLVLVIQSNSINDLITYRSGMGKTGESYVVGEDMLLRSDSFLVKSFTVTNSFNNPKAHLIDTQATRDALNGYSGKGIIKDYRGINVFSSYRTFSYNNLKWAVISEIDESEVLERFDVIKHNIFIVSGIIAIVLSAIGYFLIRKIINYSVISPLRQSLQKAQELGDIIQNSLNEIFIFDKESLMFVYTNKGAQVNTGYTNDEMKKMTPLDIKPKFNKEKFLHKLDPLLKGKRKQIVFETVHQRKNQTTYEVDVHLQLMSYKSKECFVSIVSDISEYKKTLREKNLYFERSTYDYLTRCYNRQYFDELLNVEAERAKRYSYDVSLVLMDIDNFKNVNDTYGHQIGDDVLIELSNLVHHMIRDSDTFARWGGEEFILLLPYVDKQNSVKKANEIREAIEKLNINKVGNITCSFGVTQIRDFSNVNSAFHKVDEALYLAKENGKNRVESL